MGRRSQADRDAVTIEIVYAFVSGGLAAALTFAAVYGPALAFDLSPGTGRTLAAAGGALAGTVFLLRVTHLLWRFSRRPENDGR
ncbi:MULTISPECIES: DUF6332 family protein [unclassified Streptomyces]|uniref:DUF6332 family protein n=1 Tax=Streptomyces TaxID=1883 RepID=UPI000DC7EB13|nr:MULTISPECIES: DUF6332 family protein [unclassified Streptomyces]AWZ05363.1 hypothetical protein DRB89_12610 [Streptomyces sp. ICC4]AWZ13146.1 hypothetical protein DRB96_13440 [Streptomyces sp. ICC1]